MSKWVDICMEEHFLHNSWFASGLCRDAINEGWADFTPNYFHESPRLYEQYVPVDVLMAAVSPMDKHGYFSLGVSVDYTSTAVKVAKKVILEVNNNMPRTLGDSFIHISQVDYIVENHVPLPELPVAPVTEVDAAIGQYVAELVDDGSTIQLGIGAIPNAVAQFLAAKRNLGIHSEMLTDGMVDLIERVW